MHNMQVLCPYYMYVNDHMKAMLHWQMCGLISQTWAQWTILKQLILKHLFHTFLLLFCFKSKYGYPISCKITKLYFILNIIQLPRGLKMISNSLPLLNYPFKYIVEGLTRWRRKRKSDEEEDDVDDRRKWSPWEEKKKNTKMMMMTMMMMMMKEMKKVKKKF